jgi:hypothetical protein
MKLYLKRPYEKPLTGIYYSSSDILNHFSAHVDFRQRVVRPSTKEQQRLLSSYNTPRFQHVHLGRYGIKPLESSGSLFYEQKQSNRKLSKVIIIHETVYTHKNTISLSLYINGLFI